MSNKITRKKPEILTAALALSILLMTATAIFAVTRLIEWDKGGVISLCQGAQLIIAPGALEEDTLISAEMEQTGDSTIFIFGPGGTVFADDKPAELRATWQALGIKGKDKKYVESIVLYNEDGEEIDAEPEIEEWGVVWKIPHFSIYYHRRR